MHIDSAEKQEQKQTPTSFVEQSWSKLNFEQLEEVRKNMKSPANQEKMDQFILKKQNQNWLAS